MKTSQMCERELDQSWVIEAMAEARQVEEAFQREAERKQRAHKQAIADLEKRKAQTESDWKAWTSQAEGLEERARALWVEWDRLQSEVATIAANDRELKSRLGPVEIPSEAGELATRCRLHDGLLRFGPDIKKGISR